MTDAPLDTTVAIEAPEQIRFRFRLAGPAQRAVAHAIDLGVIALVFIGIVFVLGMVNAPIGGLLGNPEAVGKAQMGVVLVVLFTLQWGYFALFEAFRRGQTPGKIAMSLRVVKTGGEPLGFVDAALRNLLRSADLMPFGYAAGFVCMLVDPRFRRLGDLVAGTMVVVEDRLRVATPLQIYPPTEQEAATLPSRVVLDADELRTVEMFLRRASELGPALATELAASVAQALGRKHGVYSPDPVRLLALLYLRATAPLRAGAPAGAAAASGPRTAGPSHVTGVA